MLNTRVYDILMIILTVIYTTLVLIQFGIDEQDFYKTAESSVFIAELLILGIFIIEIITHVFAYKLLYLKDYWNIMDICIIIVCLVFVLLDLLIQKSYAIKNLFKIRGVFRLLRIFILVRKLNAVRVRREVHKKRDNLLELDLRAPLEKVLEMLNEIRDHIHPSEAKIIRNLGYCIEMIWSNRLYEAEINEVEVE